MNVLQLSVRDYHILFDLDTLEEVDHIRYYN